VDGSCAWKKSKATAVQVAGYKDVGSSDSKLAAAVAQGPVSVGVAANDYWQF